MNINLIYYIVPVFCILFDKTGLFVFTGADDLLVKMWGTHTGNICAVSSSRCGALTQVTFVQYPLVDVGHSHR